MSSNSFDLLSDKCTDLPGGPVFLFAERSKHDQMRKD